MVWLPTPANYVKGHNSPQSDVYQVRYHLLASINACLKLGLRPSPVLLHQRQWYGPSSNFNKEILTRLHWIWLLGGLLGVHEHFLA